MDPNSRFRHSRSKSRQEIVFGRHPLVIEDVVALADGSAEASLSKDPAFRAHLKEGEQLLLRLHESTDFPIYGLSTGVGSSVINEIPRKYPPSWARIFFDSMDAAPARSSTTSKPLQSSARDCLVSLAATRESVRNSSSASA